MKKAIAAPTLAILIIIIISGIILGIGINKLATGQKKASEIEICRQSILLHNKATKATEGVIVPKIDCLAIPPPTTTDKLTGSKKQIAKGIAEHLRWCWYKTLGKDNTMGARYWIGPDFFVTDKDVCLVCSDFTTDQNIERDEVLAFMQNNYITKEGKTYAEYLDTSWQWDKVFRTNTVLSDKKDVLIAPIHDKYLIDEYDIIANKKYLVIAVNYAGSIDPRYNHVFIIAEKDATKLKCDVPLIYQKK